jgi:hypothetical protein
VTECGADASTARKATSGTSLEALAHPVRRVEEQGVFAQGLPRNLGDPAVSTPSGASQSSANPEATEHILDDKAKLSVQYQPRIRMRSREVASSYDPIDSSCDSLAREQNP